MVLYLEDHNDPCTSTDTRGQESLPESLPRWSEMEPGHLKYFKNEPGYSIQPGLKRTKSSQSLYLFYRREDRSPEKFNSFLRDTWLCNDKDKFLNPSSSGLTISSVSSLSCMLGIDYRRCFEGKLITIIFLTVL